MKNERSPFRIVDMRARAIERLCGFHHGFRERRMGWIVSLTSEARAAISTAFSLATARPYPFNPSTTIAYEVPEQTHITLTVYNLLGQEIVRLVDQVQAAGRYEAVWHGTNSRGAGVASGVYLYRIVSGSGYIETKRMTLLK